MVRGLRRFYTHIQWLTKWKRFQIQEFVEFLNVFAKIQAEFVICYFMGRQDLEKRQLPNYLLKVGMQMDIVRQGQLYF